MPLRPRLMVLYSNDAVEVRYSDGSRLHVLPCGTSFTYHKSQDNHPVHGMTTVVQQRCQYATSDYKNMLIAALDFRNRFSERPFLCEELLEKEQVVSLYAQIKEVAWPKEATEGSTEVSECGSVCVKSSDEFASLILSPHRRDFTVCCLSALSQEPKKHRKNAKDSRSSTKRHGSKESKHGSKKDHDVYNKAASKNENADSNRCHVTRDCRGGEISNERCKRCNRHIADGASKRHGYKSTETCEGDKHTHTGRSRGRENHGRCVTPTQSDENSLDNISGEDLNISPITQASFIDSPRAMSNGSGSPISPHSQAVVDDHAKYRAFSTPTEGMEEYEGRNGGKFLDADDIENDRKVSHSVRFHPPNPSGDNAEGSFLGEIQNFGESANRHRNKQSSRSNQGQGHCSEMHGNQGQSASSQGRLNEEWTRNYCRCTTHAAGDVSDSSEASVSTSSSSNDATLPSNSGDGSGLEVDPSNSKHGNRSGENKRETRYRYTWLTKHISCDECPVTWNHPVKMARDHAGEVTEQQTKASKSGNKAEKARKPTDTSHVRKIDRKLCVMSHLPSPLPLSCPGQHLHKVFSKNVYDDGKNPLEDPTTFNLGRLKVILVDGIIYRIVRLQAMKIVEIYPGDGSVLVSQGLTGQFFQHIIPNGNKVEERTYSIKTLPSNTQGGTWSVKSLISRGQRFLLHVRQEDNMPASVGLCCWKFQEETVYEPQTTTVLEECEIQGQGKFTAMSNGQVRIAFADRTCLDMTCDFSKRVLNSSTVSGDNEQKTDRVLADKKAGTCRLLLPNGHYQMVDLHHPGAYKRYTDVAQEWASWVNSTPGQRKSFYKDQTASHNMQMSVERELQKIQCFNYIVDNTVLRTSSSHQSGSGTDSIKHSSISNKPGPSILRSSDNYKSRYSGNDNNSEQHHYHPRSVQINSPPSTCNRSAMSSVLSEPIRSGVTSASCTSSVRSNPIGQFSSGEPIRSGVNNASATSSVRSNPIGQFGDSRRDFSAMNARPPPIGQASVTSSEIQKMLQSSSCSKIDGFNSVREALLRTSSVIKDIDQLLEKK